MKRIVIVAMLVLMSQLGTAFAQGAPAYYIFDMHLHPFGQGTGSGVKIRQQTNANGNFPRSVVEYDGTECTRETSGRCTARSHWRIRRSPAAMAAGTTTTAR